MKMLFDNGGAWVCQKSSPPIEYSVGKCWVDYIWATETGPEQDKMFGTEHDFNLIDDAVKSLSCYGPVDVWVVTELNTSTRKVHLQRWQYDPMLGTSPCPSEEKDEDFSLFVAEKWNKHKHLDLSKSPITGEPIKTEGWVDYRKQ